MFPKVSWLFSVFHVSYLIFFSLSHSEQSNGGCNKDTIAETDVFNLKLHALNGLVC